MKAYVFPGQGSQFVGMGKDLFDTTAKARELFQRANTILKFKITDLMFDGTDEDLRQTKVTQPAIFLHSVILALSIGEDFKPDMVAGHSLGEFSALVANKTLSFEDGLKLVYKRAVAMQEACDLVPGTMAAVIGLEDKVVEQVCTSIKDEVVVPANYNTQGQLVISGTEKGVAIACEKLLEAGARRAMPLKVGGAFHSPLMEPARIELAEAIHATKFNKGLCPIYQNTTGQSVTDPEIIKTNLIAQLTSPVRWTQIMNNMIAAGARTIVEVGPGTVLQGLFKKVDRNIITLSASL
ncbi:MAG: ACP S-malonyltransferase [Bacteroidales bacterium]|jgi:[acyl-carrier-protein] S-malonyltransferase|nr:ACP S-malonyltransferase [Bacteroidales bacterium]MDY0370402.1 ACP S-malonyltransferase [Bacteroidales bacterium]